MTKIATERTCPKCGRTRPLTPEFFYFKQSGKYRGRVTGYCRSCQNAYCRRYDHEITGPKLARRRLQQRDFQRRKEGYDPERYRVSVYEALLAGQTADQVAECVS